MESLESVREGVASGRLKGCKELRLSDKLREFPIEILALAESLELLVLSGNELRSLPPEFAQLQQLKIAFFNNNQFEQFPAILANCPRLSMVSFKGNAIASVPEGVLSPVLRWLILTDNQITRLPRDIGQLKRLQKLMLAGNKLRSLPEELSQCKHLELIRLSANQLASLPFWLLSLPRLAWIAYAGNPCCDTATIVARRSQSKSPLPSVDEGDVTLGKVLGEGASGVIYKGHWQDQTVAVKLFKGDITSDGLPIDEMRACIEAGSHPNLVSALGKIRQDGETIGLIFSFISDEYRNLGNPPSLESCTRDTYDERLSFTLPVVLSIIRGVAGAVAHLHQQGITHGDLYAHNILLNEIGEIVLGDFGAASFIEKTSAVDAREKDKRNAIIKLESRAFGYLLEDLLDRCSIDESNPLDAAALDALRHVQISCLNLVPAERPSAAEIYDLLMAMG